MNDEIDGYKAIMEDMANSVCPICSGHLSEQIVAPCYDCGHTSREVNEFEHGCHKYNVFSLWGEELILCDFCDADFGSYRPEYFGFPAGSSMDYPLEVIGEVEKPGLAKDLYCPTCKHRLAFLKFLSKVRIRNAV